MAGAEVDRISVSTAEDDGIRSYVTWFEATAADRAVVIPAFLVHEDLPALRTRTQREGVMYRHVRTVAADEAVSFRHDDPESLFYGRGTGVGDDLPWQAATCRRLPSRRSATVRS